MIELSDEIINETKREAVRDTKGMSYSEVYELYIESVSSRAPSAVRPVLPQNATPDAYRQYADDLEEYHNAIQGYDLLKACKKEREKALFENIVDKIIKAHGSKIISQRLQFKAFCHAQVLKYADSIEDIVAEFKNLINLLEEAVKEKS